MNQYVKIILRNDLFVINGTQIENWMDCFLID